MARSRESEALRAQAVVTLVLSSISTLACCSVLSIPTMVTSARAIGRATTDPGAARTLVRWSWVILIAAVLVTAGAVVVSIALAVASRPHQGSAGR